jgi:hypothetical protein
MDFQYSLSTISKILLSINKTSWLYKTVFGGLMYIAGVKVYFLCVFVLTIIDVITGIMAGLRRARNSLQRS